eukprot:4568-Rhodomonas_salina.2
MLHAVSGTELAQYVALVYDATRCPVLTQRVARPGEAKEWLQTGDLDQVQSAICLLEMHRPILSYAVMSDPDGYLPCRVMSGTDVAWCGQALMLAEKAQVDSHTSLRACYAVSGTDVAYALTGLRY